MASPLCLERFDPNGDMYDREERHDILDEKDEADVGAGPPRKDDIGDGKAELAGLAKGSTLI